MSMTKLGWETNGRIKCCEKRGEGTGDKDCLITWAWVSLCFCLFGMSLSYIKLCNGVMASWSVFHNQAFENMNWKRFFKLW